MTRTKPVTEVNTPPAANFMLITFSGEIHSARTGEDKEYHGVSATTAKRLIDYMEGGDSITVNCDDN